VCVHADKQMNTLMNPYCNRAEVCVELKILLAWPCIQ
jgi:hypothetical protein